MWGDLPGYESVLYSDASKRGQGADSGSIPFRLVGIMLVPLDTLEQVVEGSEIAISQVVKM